MKHEDLKILDRVKIVQDPDNFSHVIDAFIKQGRIVGTITEKQEREDGTEFRVRIHFGGNEKIHDLWTVTMNGDYKTLELCTDI